MSTTRKRPAVGDTVEVLYGTGAWSRQRITRTSDHALYFAASGTEVGLVLDGNAWRWPVAPHGTFDEMIGRLDRILSEFLETAAAQLDEPDRQTAKHHADDLIGVGQKALELLARPKPLLAVGDEIEFACFKRDLDSDGAPLMVWEPRPVCYVGSVDFLCYGLHQELSAFKYADEGRFWRRKEK